MRIAVVVRSLKFGGMERAACNQADAFLQAGHKVDLIYFNDKNKAIAPRETGVNIHHFDINKIFKKSIKGFLWDIFSRFVNLIVRRTYPVIKGYYLSDVFEEELKKLEAQEPYDLILIRGQGTFEQIWKFKDSRSARICVNVSLNTITTMKTKFVSRCLFENAHVNCIADGTKNFYVDKFRREDISPKTLISIKNPFYQDKVLELANSDKELLPKEPYILGLGRLVKAKNFGLLIESYKIMKDKYNINYKLMLVGEGSEKEYLKELAKKLNIEDDVVFVGYQKNPYVWMANSEAIVLTSKFEGLCNVLIEAMCCKTRIIINECPGGMRELMIGKLEQNIAKAKKENIAKKVVESLSKDKEYYHDDYTKLLDSLNPNTIVNTWLNKYVK
ncbi:glycosyltransferase [Arcobacter sp. LA11]|uniref:glycosyltransferase n=1 Tax=Arcobacter sp. LA11 TaxID=1898176 RepID=UPI000932523D|nr:glycosyltransferase [Arcobacter sp. LA11]